MNDSALNEQQFHAAHQPGTTIAVHRVVFLDGLSPLTALTALRKKDRPCFLIETARGGTHVPQLSIIAACPSKTLTDDGGTVTVTAADTPEQARHFPNVFEALRYECKQARPVRPVSLPRFAGGWVGYCGWDVARGAVGLPREHSKSNPAPGGLPDALLYRFDDLVVFDHQTNRVIIVCNITGSDNAVQDWTHAQAGLDVIEEALNNATTLGMAPPPAVSTQGEPCVVETALPYEEQVRKAKEHLALGDIFQVVLSRTVALETAATPLAIYRALRALNPSPYLFYFETEEATIVGASPEPLVRVEDGRVHIRPLAGTRRRGKTAEDDQTLEYELRDDEKERAEHLMLVDLARNDIGRVVRLGTVSVDEFMAVEKYKHVMHLASHVSGELDPAFDRFDAFEAGFPAGTMSGAPKRRAVEIIDQLEGLDRGIYSGAFGYIDMAGDSDQATGLDMAIAIRTFVHRDGKVYIRNGGGIVFDSDPASELSETQAKAQSTIAAVRLAEKGLRL